ncbi:hypothetical protein NA23_10585 [Fervidobacterium islandicum]|uniref:Uncharacterized protein n=1 Tax=Fervidobacterium islandicum TaxID=2423 RepID=A0AAJ5HQX8_FERIS|nr:hypothetical protein [Fervidobacterium islandicum]UOE96834.1 hypothetical protein NA23_10585 [Fervidobacterium islandicum]
MKSVHNSVYLSFIYIENLKIFGFVDIKEFIKYNLIENNSQQAKSIGWII